MRSLCLGGVKYFLIAVIFIFAACRKTERPDHPNSTTSALADLSAISDTVVREFAKEIIKQDRTFHFADSFIQQKGLPVWTKAVARSNGTSATTIIPVRKKGSDLITGFILGRRFNGAEFRFEWYQANLAPLYDIKQKTPKLLHSTDVRVLTDYFNHEISGKRMQWRAGTMKKSPEHQKIDARLSASSAGISYLHGGTPVASFSETCFNVYTYDEYWWDPDGADDPCHCSGNESYLYTEVGVSYVCVPSGGGGGGGDGEGEDPGTGGSGGGGGTGDGDDPYEYYWDFECECNKRLVTNWWDGTEAEADANSTWVVPPDGPALDLTIYFQYFDNTAGSTYNITIYVDQPTPNSRATYTNTGSQGSSGSSKGRIDVGHTFIGLEQVRPNGVRTVRIMGFYPGVAVNPFNTEAPPIFFKDDGHPYDVSLTTTVSQSTFFSALANFQLHKNDNYDLSNNNCTTKCLTTVDAIGIGIPQTVGTWPNGSGLNPADLGEDIHTMTLSSSQTRNPVGGYAPMNSVP